MKNFTAVLKSKKFWGGFFTALGGVLTGAMTVPDLFIAIFNLFGG